MSSTAICELITKTLHKRNSTDDLRSLVNIQNTIFYCSVRYPVSFLYCIGYRRQYLVEKVLEMLEEGLVSFENIEKDPAYQRVFAQ